MTSNDTNTNALLEKSYECESEVGMRHISFWLVGFDLMEVGPRVGTSCILEVRSSPTLKNSGSLATAVNMETGNE